MSRKLVTATILSSVIQVSSVASALVRNIIFARLLSPHDFGVAMTFGLILLFIEMMSNPGHESLMLRLADGGRRRFQATMQLATVLRGICLAILIVIFAPYIPKVLSLSETPFNYQWLAILPIINGFTHLDPRRFQRAQHFNVSTKIALVADISSIFVAIACALLIDGITAFFVSFAYRHSISSLLSHVWARRPYQWAFHVPYLRELVWFAVPILMVAFIRFFSSEGDKALVLRFTQPDVFAIYALVLLLVSSVSGLVTRSIHQIVVRQMSIATGPEGYQRSLSQIGFVTFFALTPVMLMLTFVGEELIPIIFGENYPVRHHLFFLVCTLFFIRGLVSWLSNTLIAVGKPKKLVIAQLAILTGLMIAVVVMNNLPDFRLLIGSFIIGEIAGYLYLSYELQKREAKHMWLFLGLLLAVIAVMTFAFMAYQLMLPMHSLVPRFIVGALITLLVLCVFYGISSIFRSIFWILINGVLKPFKLTISPLNHQVKK